MDVHNRLAQNLRRLRQVRNWSQEELAHQTDIHRTYVSDLERARRNPSIEVIERLAKGLNVKLGELLD
ncbi:MAG: helix-turn-helix transcriptional regulator [Pseudomonadota bacterium]